MPEEGTHGFFASSHLLPSPPPRILRRRSHLQMFRPSGCRVRQHLQHIRSPAIDLQEEGSAISELLTLDTFYRVIVPVLASISSGLVAFAIYLWNRGKELHHFRICCYCLWVETSLHKRWLTFLLEGDPYIAEVILSPDATREFDAIKFDSVMRYMNKDDFLTVFGHYQHITAVRWMLKKNAEHGITKIYILDEMRQHIADCERAISVLERASQEH